MVSAEKVNMGAVASRESTDGMAVITLTLYTTGMGQLSRLFARLEGVHGVPARVPGERPPSRRSLRGGLPRAPLYVRYNGPPR